MSDIKIKVHEMDQKLLDAYSKVSISFQVDSVYKVETKKNGLKGLEIVEESIDSYIKEYDTEGDNPSRLIKKFDVKNWRMVLAEDNNVVIGGAIIAHDTHGINMLEGKSDLAVLWDIRVDPAYRGYNIGSKIIGEVKKWAAGNQCNRLKIETQNINAKACRFYVKQGAELTGFNRHYYKDHPEEIQFIWSIYL